MKKASIWFLLLILIGFQQPHMLEYQNGNMDGDVLKADDSHLTSIEVMLPPPLHSLIMSIVWYPVKFS
ncbi:hypothetical protein FHE72_04990 [Rossellomorea vietnamensis]|uniref:Uncharacterized protein n=1 Tax=Rossellomorea vietnamensis TaxID=218284 RepID=A0A6I6ULM0_9BACI|nr:hypothetical protein [Rossellomorea vietnamensis]QHE60469.1 hypothetical protein FHE72_04990 [Rossellomorea vietnamensis]